MSEVDSAISELSLSLYSVEIKLLLAIRDIPNSTCSEMRYRFCIAF